jgi:hypothetical protein
MPYFVPKASRISLIRDTRFWVSSGLPPREGLAGYSQSSSAPWKPHLSINSVSEEMNAALFAEVEHMSDHVVKVGPGSLKSNPPITIQVCNIEDLSAVNSEYRARSPGSVGVMLKLVGSIEAKAKFRWVSPSILICEGAMRLQIRYRTLLEDA